MNVKIELNCEDCIKGSICKNARPADVVICNEMICHCFQCAHVEEHIIFDVEYVCMRKKVFVNKYGFCEGFETVEQMQKRLLNL